MKKCTKCKETKSIDEFGRDKSRSDGLQARCRPCAKEQQRLSLKISKETGYAAQKAYKKRQRLALIDELGGKCACCSESTYEFLEIDHINNNGGQYRKTLRKRVLEPSHLRGHIEELQVLCANCHRAKSSWGFCPHPTWANVASGYDNL